MQYFLHFLKVWDAQELTTLYSVILGEKWTWVFSSCMKYDKQKTQFFCFLNFSFHVYFPLIITLVCVDIDYFFFGITLSIISLIFSLLKDSTSSISNTSKVRSSYFFVVIKCNFSLAQKSTKKFTIPQLLWFVLHKKKKYCIREKDYGEKSQSISLNYLIFYSDPNEWTYHSIPTLPRVGMYKNRVKKDKILFLKFLLFCRLVHDDEIQSRKIENNTNILNFPSPYSADSPRALKIEPYFQNISVVLYPISI